MEWFGPLDKVGGEEERVAGGSNGFVWYWYRTVDVNR